MTVDEIYMSDQKGLKLIKLIYLLISYVQNFVLTMLRGTDHVLIVLPQNLLLTVSYLPEYHTGILLHLPV